MSIYGFLGSKLKIRYYSQTSQQAKQLSRSASQGHLLLRLRAVVCRSHFAMAWRTGSLGSPSPNPRPYLPLFCQKFQSMDKILFSFFFIIREALSTCRKTKATVKKGKIKKQNVYFKKVEDHRVLYISMMTLSVFHVPLDMFSKWVFLLLLSLCP